MRPCFSLRWLLIAFTVLSVFFYALVVRPTVIAKQFVSSVNRGDLAELQLLHEESVQPWPFVTGSVYAELVPLKWTDFKLFRRKIAINTPTEEAGKYNCVYIVFTNLNRTWMEPDRYQR